MLYKFYSFESHVIESLSNDLLYFASRHDFNDPIDCNPPFKETDYDKFKALYYKVLSNIKNCDPKFLEFASTDSFLNVLWESINDISVLKERVELISDNAKILCLSRSNDSPLMWGHYANGHRGFCVGYDIQITSDLIFSPELFLKDDVPVNCREITYSNKPIDSVECYLLSLSLIFEYSSKRDDKGFLSYQNALDVFKNGNVTREFTTNYIIEHLTQKHESWSYEEEVRAIVFPDDDKKLHVHKKGLIKKVIFGAKMPQSQRQTIESIIGKHNVSYFESALSEDEIGLKINPLLDV